jgi:hypothetical protein
MGYEEEGGPTYGTNEGVSLFLSTRQYSTHTKVDELDVSRFSKKDVGSFDIAVDDTVLVEVFETSQRFTTNQGNLFFFQFNVPYLRHI